jgi:hypothetical protein
VQVSSTRDGVRRDARGGSGNRIDACSGSKALHEGNRVKKSRIPNRIRRKATGGGSGVTRTEVWRKARNLEQAGGAEMRRQASLGRDAEDELGARSRTAKARRGNVESGDRG